VVRCTCHSPWCERASCRRRSLRRVAEELLTWEWERVRLVTPTIDRKLFESGEAAYDACRSVSEYVKRVKRLLSASVPGLVIVAWKWVLEFHEDGYPHWHMMFLMNRYGKAAQMPVSVLQGAWDQGNVDCGYVRDSVHWANLVGYLGKGGYFGKGKNHQVTLPEWAKSRPSGSIRKWGGSTARESGTSRRPATAVSGVRAPRRTYQAQLQDCGEETKLMVGRVIVSVAASAERVQAVLAVDPFTRWQGWVEHRYYVLFDGPEYLTDWAAARTLKARVEVLLKRMALGRGEGISPSPLTEGGTSGPKPEAFGRGSPPATAVPEVESRGHSVACGESESDGRRR